MYRIKNCMEDFVLQMVEGVTANMKVCRCEKCKLDIVALALNDLPARYIVSEKGEIYTKLEMLRQQFEVDIVSAITRAAEIVAAHPRHESGSNT